MVWDEFPGDFGRCGHCLGNIVIGRTLLTFDIGQQGYGYKSRLLEDSDRLAVQPLGQIIDHLLK